MMNQFLLKSFVAASLLFTVACTKDRPQELPDGAGLGLFSKEEISGAVMQIGGGSDAQNLDDDKITFLRVNRVEGPEKLKFMFRDLSFVGALSKSYEVRYVLNADSVVAVKILNANDPLAAEDRELATVDGDKVRIPLFKYKAEYGRLVRSRNDLGEETSILRFEKTSFTDATHVKIDSTLEARIPIQDIDIASSPKNLMKSQVLNKEFLYRRTLQDVPNEFNYAYVGATSNLEIVKFVFKRDAVQIVRADALTERGDNSNLDLEVLLSIPVVQYKKAIYKNELGEALAIPKFETTDFRDPEAIAELDWSKNEVLSSSSPLSLYGAGQCFSSKGQDEITNMRKNLEKGILSFTIVGSYSSNSSQDLDCAGFYGADYFDVVQTNFTFKERVSFQEYLKSDEKPLLDVPYTAQKLLGFGLFTFSKNNPNDLGSVGNDGSKIPLPAVFDIKNGKKIKYVLGGLPDSNITERNAIIKATQEVIDDLNKGFRQALAHSSLAREDNVIELAIEGEDVAKGELGDIDRNYIYYVQKASNAGLLGLGGSHSNPRSGRVEAGSVFLYGGNTKTYVDHLKRLARVKKSYNQIMGQVQVLGEVAAESEDADGIGGAVQDIPTGPGEQVLQSVSDDRVDPALVITNLNERINHFAPRNARHYSAGMSAVRLGTRALESTLTPDVLAILETLRDAATSGDVQNAAMVASIYNEKSLKFLGERFNRQRSKIAALAAQSRISDKVKRNLAKSNLCALDVSDANLTALVDEIAKSEDEMTDVELLVRIYKPTLAHEIGHNLGLRHNFIGSYDKANFKFNEADTSKRDYSSVMDYMTTDHMTYDGLGPYDVAALRSAYTGLLELTDEGLSRISDTKKIVAKKYIHVDDYKKELGITSWLKLNEEVLTRIPLKKYMFCSDEDAGVNPTCNRFDLGASPTEVVNNIIKEYRSTYGYRNFRLDRINFDYWNAGNYIGRLFTDFIRIRQFLEEGLYLAISGKESSEYIPHLQAAINGMQFFQSVIGAPDLLPNSTDEERFIRAETQMNLNGKLVRVSVPVELKRTEDKAAGDGTDALAVRGIEYDKIIALIALTERSFGFKRYEQVSLRTSFPEVERMVLLEEGESAADGPTMAFLKAIMQNQMPALAHNPINGQVFMLPGTLASSVTESVRAYAILGAIQFLDVNGLEEKDNLSSFFRVLSGFKVPTAKKVVHVAGLNDTLSSQTILKYFTDPSSESSKSVIDNLDALAQIHKKAKKLTPALEKWFSLQLEGRAGDDAEVVAEIGKINAELAKMPATVENKDFNTVSDLIMTVVSFAQELNAMELQVGKPGGPDAATFQTQLELRSNLVERVSKQEPLLMTMLSMMPDLSEAFGESSRVLQKNTMTRHYGLMLSNVRLLNQIFYEAHPEYKQ